MPISSPSAFLPPKAGDTIDSINSGISTGARCFFAGKNAGNGSTQSDLIIIGDVAGSAGLTDANMEYSVIIGSESAVAYNDATGSGLYAGPLVNVGGNNCPNAPRLLPSTVMVGANILAAATNYPYPGAITTGRNVFVGNYILNDTLAVGEGGGAYQLENNVMVGDGIAAAATYASATNWNVVVGSRAATNLGNGNSGGGACTYNVIVGGGAAVGLAGINASYNTVVGASAGGQLANNRGCIAIGYNAGNQSNGSDHLCWIESEEVGQQPAGCLYSDMLKGNVLLGNSNAATNTRVFSGNGTATNILKLIYGTPSSDGTGGAGGGYFYCTGTGQLHWVNSTGGDTYIAG